MNSSKRSPDSLYSRWRVYTTFATGILIGLFYTIIASEKFGDYLKATAPAFPFYNLIDQRVLVLAFSGILGGLIYSIIVDGYVELPRFVDSIKDGIDREDGFRAGIFGDFILGLAGAFVLDFLTSPIGLNASSRQAVLESTPIIATAAKGIIGGYGGKAILIFALEKVFKNVDRLEEEKARYAEESFQSKLDGIEIVQLLDQLNQQIKDGLPEAEVIKLQQDIRAASSKIKQQVFSVAEDARSAGNFSEVTRPRIERTIPIFEALRDSDPKNPEYYAQLAYSYKDGVSPDYLKSLDYISQAIRLRGDHVQGKAWRYELNRAILLIQREHERTNGFALKEDDQEQVVQDLLSVTRHYSLTNIIEDAKRKQIPLPVVDWATQNKALLERREDTKNIVIQLQQQVRVTTDEDSKETQVTRTQAVIEKHDNGSSTKTITTSQTTTIAPINQIPQAAIDLIKKYEGFSEHAYADPKAGWSLPTIGFGTIQYPDGRNVRQGETISREKAEEYLKAHVEKRCRPALMKIPTWNQMNENQHAALYSFAYNLGEDFYRGEDFDSITLVCDSPAYWGDRQWIADQFVKYRNPGTNVEEGLRKRRLEEAELFCRSVVNSSRGKTVETGHVSSPNSSAMSGKSATSATLTATTATMARTHMPALQKVVKQNHLLKLDVVTNDQTLAKEIQQTLIQLELLDAPADGAFGPISTSALFEFQSIMLPKAPELAAEKGALGPRTVESLLSAEPSDFRPELKLSNDLASRIIKYMKAKNYYIFTGEQKYNIVYVEGMDPDGTLNDDVPNRFNDVRMVIECKAGVPNIVGCWEGTSEPGTYYTENPPNAFGVARIKFGQYKAWVVGEHVGSSSSHEALVQDKPITVCRDGNRDMSRRGDREHTGVFWINQHCGFNLSREDIDTASAGCLVGRTVEGHEAFMRIIKQDKRYQKNRGYTFYTTVISGEELDQQFPPS